MIILSRPSKTAWQLARVMGIPIVYRARDVNEHTVIRWGNILPLNSEHEVINKRQAIIETSNKYLFIKKMQENGLPVPHVSEETPCVGRPYHHQQGRKFFLCHTSEEVLWAKRLGAQYFTKYFHKTKEYRVHIGFDRTILMSEKVGPTHHAIWNTKHGFTFRHMGRSEWREDEWKMNMVRDCKRAIKLAGLHFGAVDIMANDEEYKILEVNTAPSLSPLAVEKYAECLRSNLL